MRASARSHTISESITLAIAARAKAMRAEGIDVVSLSAGEPDFPTYAPVAAAGTAAIEAGKTRYTATSGTPELRVAAARWFERFGLNYDASEVMITAGAKPALTLALFATIDPGDRVLTPAPYWPSYPEIVKLAGGVPVDIPASPASGFIPTGAEVLAAAREHGAVGVMLNFPNNPSGAVPTRAQVEELVAAATEADIFILSDEIYARLIYGGAEHVSPATIAGARDRVLVVNGGTKSHSMTGWRVGFLAGPAPIIAAAGRYQSQAIGNPCSISQEAALEVCAANDDAEMARRLAAFAERRDYLIGAINETDGLSVRQPQGAFYALVDASVACEKFGLDDVELCQKLLDEGRVATVPGSAFAIPGFLRLSYACSMDDLKSAMARIRTVLMS